MLAKEDEVDAEVTWEDQQKINTFGRLTNLLRELQDDRKIKKELMENMGDAESETMMADDTLIKYFIGEVFINMPREAAEQMIAEQQEKTQKQIDTIDAKISNINETLSSLKSQLKAKFKNSINLDAEEAQS